MATGKQNSPTQKTYNRVVRTKYGLFVAEKKIQGKDLLLPVARVDMSQRYQYPIMDMFVLTIDKS